MSDKITLELEIDLADVARSRTRQIGEDDWVEEPWTWSQAVVERAADRLVDLLIKDKLLTETRDRLLNEMLRAHVAQRLGDALNAPIRRTNEWGEPTGPEITLGEMVGKEITRQLTQPGLRHDSDTVLQRVIRECVNSRLDNDLREAFQTARQAMLNAATEAGKKALQAAVGQAFR